MSTCFFSSWPPPADRKVKLELKQNTKKPKQEDWHLPDRSALRVIAFGGNGSTAYDPAKTAAKLKQMPFVRGRKIDPLGGEEMLAMAVSWKQVGWIEGESDVLNHSMFDLEDMNHTP